MYGHRRDTSSYHELLNAIRNSRKRAAIELLKQHPPVNNTGYHKSNSPLHWAIIKFDDTEIIKMLLDRGASVFARNGGFQTPFHVAIRMKKLETFQLLWNHPDYVSKNITNELIAFAITKGSLNILEYLLDKIESNHLDIDFSRNLKPAIEKGQVEIIKLFIPHLKNLDASAKKIPKFLFMKNQPKVEECIKILLENGFTAAGEYCQDREFIFAAVKKDLMSIVEENLNKNENTIAVNMRNKNNHTLLHVACANKNFKIAEMLINNGADINATVIEKHSKYSNRIVTKTPLFMAVENYDAEIVKLLLDNDAKITDSPSPSEIFKVCMATYSKEILEIFLKQDIDVNYVDSNQETFLHICCTPPTFGIDDIIPESKRRKIMDMLIRKGANVNAVDDENKTPIYHAILYGYDELVEFLLQHNADINHLDYKRHTPLHEAVENSKFDSIKTLLNRTAKLNITDDAGKTPFHYSCIYLFEFERQVEVIQMLIHHGADIHAKDDKGYTGLHYAAEGSPFNVIKFLLDHKYDPNAKTKDGKTPLHLVADRDKSIPGHDNVQIVKLLLQHNADVNAVDDNGNTPMHLACIQSNVDVVECLIENKGDMNFMNKNGRTPLCAAITMKCVKLLRFLRYLSKTNANFYSVSSDGQTLLHAAIASDKTEIIEFLLDHDIDLLNAQDNQGRTALHLATEGDNDELISTLLSFGADINVVDKNNETAMNYAIKNLQNSLEEFKSSSRIERGEDFYYDYSFMSDDDEDEDYFYNFATDVDQIITSREIADNLREHIIKLECAGLYVNEVNRYSVHDFDRDDSFDEDIIDDWEYYDPLDVDEFKSDCLEEIAMMKMKNVGHLNINFYELLTCDVKKTKHIDNRVIMDCLESDNYSATFSLYYDIIKCRLAERIRRYELLETLKGCALYRIFQGLPDDCSEVILSYLNNRELKSLLKAIKPNTTA